MLAIRSMQRDASCRRLRLGLPVVNDAKQRSTDEFEQLTNGLVVAGNRL